MARRRYNQALFMKGRKYMYKKIANKILIHSVAPHELSHATSHAGIWSEVRNMNESIIYIPVKYNK